MNMRIENWCGHDIRFVDVKGEWFAILKDVCDALGLKSKDISQRLDTEMMTRVKVEASEVVSNDVRSPGENKTRWMLAINELGIYEALFTSRKLEARKFRRWSATVMQKLRNRVGLEGYEVMRMTEPEIQADIDHILDTLFWDEDKKILMQSVTVQGGDVEQIPFE
jgi:prophage antirepressor-like protein